MVLFLLEWVLLLKIGVRRMVAVVLARSASGYSQKIRAKRGLGRRAERDASMTGNGVERRRF